MQIWPGHYNVNVARLLLLPMTGLLVAASPSDIEEKPACEQLPACRAQRAAGLESQAKGQLDVALERLQAAYALSQDFRLQASIGRVLQQLGRGDDAFAAYQQFLQVAPYNHSLRPTVEQWLRQLLESPPAGGPEHAAEATPVSAPPPAPPAQPCPRPKLPLARQVSGGLLLGLGAAGMVASTILYTKNGALAADGSCEFDGMPYRCRFDTSPAFATGYALSAASLAGGVLVLALPGKRALRESGGASPCKKP